MNADGSNGIAADVSAGAKLPWLDEAGWAALGIGVLFAGGTVALLAAAFPRRRASGALAPSAA